MSNRQSLNNMMMSCLVPAVCAALMRIIHIRRMNHSRVLLAAFVSMRCMMFDMRLTRAASSRKPKGIRSAVYKSCAPSRIQTTGQWHSCTEIRLLEIGKNYTYMVKNYEYTTQRIGEQHGNQREPLVQNQLKGRLCFLPIQT